MGPRKAPIRVPRNKPRHQSTEAEDTDTGTSNSENDRSTTSSRQSLREISQSSDASSRNSEMPVNTSTKVLKALAPILESSQSGHLDNKDLIEDVFKVYDKYDRKTFITVIWRMMVVPFQEKEKSEKIERLIAFFYQLLRALIEREQKNVTCHEDSQQEDNTMGTNIESKNKFRHYILRLCEKSHFDKRPSVRARVVKTIVTAVDTCNNLEADLHPSMHQRVVLILLERLKDKIHTVRVEAAKGLHHFQKGEKCSVTQQMMEFIRLDPKPEVRKALVKNIILDTDEYSGFLERVRDVHPDVRKACLGHIPELVMDEISIEQKEKILECGLKDQSPAVKAEALALLRTWFDRCGNIATFLHKFDVYNRSKFCIKLLNLLYPNADEDSWAVLEDGLLQNQIVPVEEVSELKMFRWWYLFHRFSSQPFYMQKLNTSAPTIRKYFKHLLKQLQARQAQITEEEATKIIGYFFKIVLFLPVEEGGRIVLDEIAREGFKCKLNLKAMSHMRHLVLLLHKAHPGGCDELLLEYVRDMMDILSTKVDSANGVIAQQKLEEEIRKLKIGLGEKLHERYKLDSKKSASVSANDFIEAQNIQNQINDVQAVIDAARAEIESKNEIIRSKSLESEPSQTPAEYGADAISLALSALMVHLKLHQSMGQYIRNFHENEVMKFIYRPEPEIRSQVLQVLTLVADICSDLAVGAFEVCIKAVVNDEAQVRLVALQCVFDLLLKYGFEKFDDHAVMAIFVPDFDGSQSSESVDKLIMDLLMSNLKSQDDEPLFHVTALGILKLLIMNRITAPKVVSTLLTFWADSANEGTKHYHDIGAGLSVYAQQSIQNAEVVGRALTPSVSKVLNSPIKSSFRRVDPEKLIGFVIMQTDQSKLQQFSNPFIPHQVIAFDVLDEMRKKAFAAENAIYAKALKALALHGISKDSLQELKSKLKQVIRNEVKSTRVSLEAFGKYLDDLDPEVDALDAIPEQNSDPESDIEAGDNSSQFQSWRADATVRSQEPRENTLTPEEGTFTSTKNDTLRNSVSATSHSRKRDSCPEDSDEDTLH